MCIVLCPNIVQTFSSRSVVTPHHRCVIMYEVVNESLPKLCHDQQNVPQHYHGVLLFSRFWTGYFGTCQYFFAVLRFWAPSPPPPSPMFPICKCLSARLPDVVLTGENDTKTISVDANLFENGAKQLLFV